MQVISKKNNRRLISGQDYETDYFHNDPSKKGYGFGRISIKGKGYYKLDDFKRVDGSDLPQILYDVRKFNTEEDIKKGDIIVCNRDNRYKYLIKDGKYRIQDITNKKTKYTIEKLMKLEGYNKWIRYDPWSFRKLSLQETRDLALSQIFDKAENFSVEFKTKYEQSDNKEKILIEAIAASILDKHRHHLDIIDWGLQKIKKGLKIDRKDYDQLLGLTLGEILSKVENFPNK